MDIEQLTQELNQLHIDHAKIFSMAANSFASFGETGVMLWLSCQQDEVFAVDIIEHFGITAGRVANIIKKLEERGYLSRKHNYVDLRKSNIRLTESGAAYAAGLYERMNANHLQIIKALGEEDASQALLILKKIITYFENNPQ